MVNFHGISVDPERVAMYIRWSTDEQSEGTTLEVQREACEHYLLAQGWKVNRNLVFIDDGYSGGSLERPGLSALRRQIKDGKVTCVVVFKLDRLSRSVIDTVNLVLEEWEGLCYLKSTREPVDTTTSAGKMFFYMLASYAEWERSVIRERTLSGKVKRAQQGKNPGFPAPYGYAHGSRPGEFVLNDAEATVVRRVFAEYTAGRGIHAIAAGLYADGIKPRRAKRWHATTISQMLSNRAYMGVLEYGKTTLTPRALRDQVGTLRMGFDEPRYAVVEGAFPIIVPPEEFEAARRVYVGKAAVQGKRSLGADFLLTGVARCTCGGWLRGDSRSGKGHRYYRCCNTQASRPTPCEAGLIPADELDGAVVAEIVKAFAPSNLDHFREEWRDQVLAHADRLDQELAMVRESLAQAGRRRTRLDADYDAGDLPARLYAQRVEQLEAECARLQAAEQRALAELEEVRQARFHQGELDSVASKVDAWEHLNQEERKQVLRHAVASCEAYRRPVRARAGERPSLEVTLTVWRPSLAASPGQL